MARNTARLPLVFPSLFSKCSRRLFILTLTLLACVLSSTLARAQATTSVRGTVTDQNGNAVLGANVVLANAESKTERTVTTGDQGEYQFLLIPPGAYTLTVKAAGFRSSGFEALEAQLVTIQMHLLLHEQGRIQGALGVIFVSDGCTEQRKDAIAGRRRTFHRRDCRDSLRRPAPDPRCHQRRPATAGAPRYRSGVLTPAVSACCQTGEVHDHQYQKFECK